MIIPRQSLRFKPWSHLFGEEVPLTKEYLSDEGVPGREQSSTAPQGLTPLAVVSVIALIGAFNYLVILGADRKPIPQRKEPHCADRQPCG